MVAVARRGARTARLVLAVWSVAVSGLALGARSPVAAQDGATTTSLPPVVAGRVAYVTPAGDVVVAQDDGSSPVTVGSGAVRNANGLAPLAWEARGVWLAYVRNDRALVLVRPDGSRTRVVADDAVVPPQADEAILSFDPLSQTISYVGDLGGGRYAAKLAVLDGPDAGRTIRLGDEAERVPVRMRWSPSDVFLGIESRDLVTGRDLTVAVATVNGTVTPTNFSVDDIAFGADGTFVYGVVRGFGDDQLGRIEVLTGRYTALYDRPHICGPSPSPDGRSLVVAAGDDPGCREVWAMEPDGANRRQVAASVGGTADLSVGEFSWSFDGRTVSHADCRRTGDRVDCNGPYWDIPLEGAQPVPRAPATSVLREARAVSRVPQITVTVSGARTYETTLQISPQSGGEQPLSSAGATVVAFQAVDRADARKTLDLQLSLSTTSRWGAGSMRLRDPATSTDLEVTLLGSGVVTGLRYAAVRGVWVDTSRMPLTSGLVDLVIRR